MSAMKALRAGQSHRKLAMIAVLVGSAVFLVWLFPLFHISSLTHAQARQKAANFDANRVAAAFWDGKLRPAMAHAVDAKTLLSALATNAAVARKQYGRSFGLSSTSLFFLRGTGRVVYVDDDFVLVELDGTGTRLSLGSGPVFGNTVRDATGLLDVSAYANSQDFNAISERLNAIVEERVSPSLREVAAVGKAIAFVGCAELERDATPEPLSVVVVRVEWL